MPKAGSDRVLVCAMSDERVHMCVTHTQADDDDDDGGGGVCGRRRLAFCPVNETPFRYLDRSCATFQ